MIFIRKKNKTFSVMAMAAGVAGLLVTFLYFAAGKENSGKTNVSLPSRDAPNPAIERAAEIPVLDDVIKPEKKNRSLTPDEKACDRYLVKNSGETEEDNIIAAQQAGRNEIAAGLMAEKSEMERAAGIYFLTRAQRSIQYKNCQNENCIAGGEDRFIVENDKAIAELVSIASATKAPEIYQWALDACTSERVRSAPGNSCATLSRQRAVALDPSNGWGWLALAAEANGQKNTSGSEEALFKAANANVWGAPLAGLEKLLAGRIDQNSDPLVTMILLNDIKSIHFENIIPTLSALSMLCPESVNENKKQVCQTLTTKILNSTTEVVGLSIGLKVGARVGIPEPQLERFRNEYAQVKSFLPAGPMLNATDTLSSCRNAIPVITLLQNSVLKGELGAIKEAMAPAK